MRLGVFLFFFFLALETWGAACCGGGFAVPSLISGDEKAKFTLSYSRTEVAVDNVDVDGIWRVWDIHQQTQAVRLEGAHILFDRWQLGFILPVLQRTRLDQASSGLGDVAVSAGYEFLPDWSYHPFRPHGIAYLQVVLPTGKSRMESETGGLDSRGNGFLSAGAGTLLTKEWGKWDGFVSLEGHRSFSKQIRTSVFQGSAQPGLGWNAGGGGGYNTPSWRFGGSLIWTSEDPVVLAGNIASAGMTEKYATAFLGLTYLVSEDWAGTFGYSDQTLFGSPLNTSLGRSVALQIQRRWSR